MKKSVDWDIDGMEMGDDGEKKKDDTQGKRVNKWA